MSKHGMRSANRRAAAPSSLNEPLDSGTFSSYREISEATHTQNSSDDSYVAQASRVSRRRACQEGKTLTRRQIRLEREMEEALKLGKKSRRSHTANVYPESAQSACDPQSVGKDLDVCEPSRGIHGSSESDSSLVALDSSSHEVEEARTESRFSRRAAIRREKQRVSSAQTADLSLTSVSAASVSSASFDFSVMPEAEVVLPDLFALQKKESEFTSEKASEENVVRELSLDQDRRKSRIRGVPAQGTSFTRAPFASESSASTSVMSTSEISAALKESARLSRVERRKREGLYTPAKAVRAGKEEQHTRPAVGSRKWALQGIAAGIATLAVVSVPFVLSQGSAAVASQTFTGSFVAGQEKTVADTPAALSADPNAAVKSAAVSAEKESASQTCTTQNSAAGVRAAFSSGTETANTVVMPLSEGSYRLTSAFGYRVDPIYGGTSMHAGQDMAAPLNTPIYAVADGVVTHAGAGIEGRSNNLIIVKHEIKGKVFYSWYVHMYNNGVLVKEGDKVTAGQRIGLVGSNGNSTGPHLHLEIHDEQNQLLEPMSWLKSNNAIFVSRLCN